MNKKIKALIFDLGGVVRYFQNGKHHEYCYKKLGLTKEEWFRAINPVFLDSITNKVSLEETINYMCKNLNLIQNEIIQLWKEAYDHTLSPNIELIEFIKKIKRDYKTAILSDQWHISRPLMMPKSLEKYFDVLVFSNEVGLRKPGKEIYKLTLNKLKCKSEECIFVDDDKTNIKPAKELGFKTILFKNNEQFFRELKKLTL